MKKYITSILLILTLFSYPTYAGGNKLMNMKCPVTGYKDKACPSYIIAQVNSKIKKIGTDEHQAIYYTLKNGYFFDIKNGIYNNKIDNTIINFDSMKTIGSFTIWDYIIFDAKIFIDNHLEVNEYLKVGDSFNEKWYINSSLWTYCKIDCENNKLSLSNIGSSHNLLDDNNYPLKTSIIYNKMKESNICNVINTKHSKSNNRYIFRILNFFINFFD